MKKGFTTLEAVLVLIIISLVGVIVWGVVSNSSEEDPGTNDATSNISENETQESENSADEKQDAKVDTVTIPDGWLGYENDQYGISLYYPSEAELTESQNSDYYKVFVEHNDGNNPNNHFYGEGNYKIEIHITENTTIEELVVNAEGSLSEITEEDGTRYATYSDDTFGPSTTYYREKNSTVVSIFPWGDFDNTETFLELFVF